jgi:hypothetical protein
MTFGEESDSSATLNRCRGLDFMFDVLLNIIDETDQCNLAELPRGLRTKAQDFHPCLVYQESESLGGVRRRS